MPQWLVIGISGVTCAGKTTLANKLYDYFIKKHKHRLWNTIYIMNSVKLIAQDDYFLPVDDSRHQRVSELNVINYEILTAIDMKRLIDDVQDILKSYGSENHSENSHIDDEKKTKIEKCDCFLSGYWQAPINCNYNNSIKYESNHMSSVCFTVNTRLDREINILIIEGFLIFNHSELLALCNIKFFCHLPYEKCFERRLKRVYDPPDVTGYFEKCVWPYYEKHFAEIRNEKDLIYLNGDLDVEKIYNYALQQIMNYLIKSLYRTCITKPHKFQCCPTCCNILSNNENS